ncbi:pilus assembly protein PilL [Scandinavium goeteborgense]|uniref:Toxin co-regulated pilus biosynthesis protein Q n=1 Tax=Scandinavium goeteborgense TaxID=1851514 RepID=A0A4R6DSL7_SCAGO|nr:pilus assembly protein PilL [Scandinavium goeteborgense]TDN48067.1 hypothetical protein EC847_12818 [Scandinavium goeteborgense]
MKTMSIKAITALCLALPLYVSAATGSYDSPVVAPGTTFIPKAATPSTRQPVSTSGNPFAAQQQSKPVVTSVTTSPARQVYGYDYQVNGSFTNGGSISASATDPRWQFVDPTSVYMRTVWPEDVTTIRQAVSYLLEPTGYRLVTRYPAPRESALLVDKPIPPIAKLNRTMPVVDALQLLVGLKNYVVIDHAHHLVSFQRGE